MATINLHDSLHARIKHVIIDSGITLKQFVHNSIESAVSSAEETISKAKKSTEAKAKQK